LGFGGWRVVSTPGLSRLLCLLRSWGSFLGAGTCSSSRVPSVEAVLVLSDTLRGGDEKLAGSTVDVKAWVARWWRFLQGAAVLG
jgi:hypothetical protein